jgi:hypothetical protein
MGQGVATNTCIELVADGDPCAYDSDCLSYQCTAGACRASAPICNGS